MPFALSTPAVDQLDDVVADVGSWQEDGLPVQLHPGDLGWHRRFGATRLADAVRVWRDGRTTLAVGFLDGESVVRMAIAPRAAEDRDLARAIVGDLEEADRGVVPTGEVAVEARFGPALRALLRARGWVDGEPWTPLVRDLGAPIEETGLRVVVVGREDVEDRVEVHRAAFEGSTFTAGSWREMSRSRAYEQARCLVGYDTHDHPVAAVTVWSAGRGRPGLLEPLGVHRDHRGRGHGAAISVAAAAALQRLGASSALVATPSSNGAAVATYVAAGYRRRPQATDFVLNR